MRKCLLLLSTGLLVFAMAAPAMAFDRTGVLVELFTNTA